MTKPIKDEVSIQLYGDAEVQERLLKIVSNAFDVELRVTSEKDYETKKGMSGHYIAAKLKLSDS